jgi:uncharacterized protein with HEPN domain
MTREQFMSDRKTQHACIRDLEVIREAVKHLPPDLRDRALEIEWQKIAGLRDILTHEYFGVDYLSRERTRSHAREEVSPPLLPSDAEV